MANQGQRFSVELERINTYRTKIEVQAENIADARRKAMERARRETWDADIGALMVKKITAHSDRLKATP